MTQADTASGRTVADWFLSATERGNPATILDSSHPDGLAWTSGNRVRPLIHGAAYFAALREAVDRMRAGDLLLFADWRGDPDERLTPEGPEVGRLLAGAAQRGVAVYGLIWRSHLDRLQFSSRENRHLGEEIDAAGGCCLLDMRVRPGGSHHQKFVVLRHPGRPELDIAYLGGIDLCHSRRDDAAHHGDPQPQPMAAVYGARPPWHDVQLAITGPAVADVETVFRERWNDEQPLTRNPVHRLADLTRGDDRRRKPLPPQLAAPGETGPHSVQLLRTYADRGRSYAFAPHGERSIARGYLKAVRRAEQLIYIEDQYLWSREVAGCLAAALRTNPDLHMIAVLPHYPDQDGRALPPNLIGRNTALAEVLRAGPGRVGIYGLENEAGTPIYVHAKVCVIDDTWVSVGSDNFNRRSWTHDSELTAAVWDESASSNTDSFAATLRSALAREHLGIADDTDDDVNEPVALFEAFRSSAERLQRWQDGGRPGPRPPGRLRPLAPAPLPLRTRLWAAPMCRFVYDPDGRRVIDRWRNRY
jgi:phosphatidylserine/phosphatidylglycerophosphate/cardiolipin synthase-like enzyme